MDHAVSKRSLVKNALSNVVSGTSAALLAVVLPPILIRGLSSDVYGVWVLILQIGAYTGLLNFGIQVAVGRFVAHYGKVGDLARQNELVSTAWAALCAAGLLAALAMIGFSIYLPYVFPKIPAAVRTEAQIAMAWVGVSLAIGLPFSTFMGIFVGMQRNEIPALILIASRLLTGIALAWIALRVPSLQAMAEAFALINILTYLMQYVLFRAMARGIHVRMALARRWAAAELGNYCFSLTVWNVAMLFVSGLDLALVGWFDFPVVAAYSVAAGLITFITGLQNAVFNVLIPAGAVLAAGQDEFRLKRLLLNSTRYGMLLLLLSGIPLYFGCTFFLNRYVGVELAPKTAPILKLLIIGNVIRLSAAPYAVLLLGTGQQRIVLLTPILEGVVNLLFSVGLGLWMGALGVAIGTIIGAVVGFMGNLIYNMPRTRMISISVTEYIADGLVRPLLTVIPWIFWAMLVSMIPSPVWLTMGSAGVSALATVAILWFWVAQKHEHDLLFGAFSRWVK